MRELLFRGKRVDNGEWLESKSITQDGDEVFLYEDCEDHYLGHKVVPETVGQYTGLLDTNDKKIFDGDIVKRGERVSDIKGNIANCSCCHSVYGFSTNDENLSIFYCEVIGNIHDSPELLEGKE